MSMTYEAWRISFQSSEQAARSAYNQLIAAQARINAMSEAALSRQAKFQKRENELLADNARLRGEMIKCKAHIRHPETLYYTIEDALAATPAQSLASIRNQVRDECIEIIACNLIGFADDDEDLNNMIAKISAMKE